METYTTDTPLSSSHPSRNGAWLPRLRPPLTRAPFSRSWHTACDSSDPCFIAPCSDPGCAHITFARNHAFQGGHTQLLYTNSDQGYLSPPPSSSSKSTMSLPEEADEAAPLYSTHLAGVLDSPPVMRRQVLASQKPLTPPPTMPHPTLNLPDADVDAPSDGQELEDIDEDGDFDESCSRSSGSSSSCFDHPLSPLSPTWDTPYTQALPIASPQDFPESEHSNALFLPCYVPPPPALDCCHPSPRSPHIPSSLLEVDVDGPHGLFPPASWDLDEPSESDPESPSMSTLGPSLTSLIDHDELSPPSSPLISRRDLPDLEDDGLPKIAPSSPSRRSYSGLPDSDVEIGNPTSDVLMPLPGQHLLSLPGAETDDDLIPRIAALSRSFPLTPSQPLLFIDDPRDVPLPRSPSPEDFDLRLSPEDITDPELTKLFDLRKRSIAAERAARRVESLTEDVDLFTRAEARKVRKRERERSKEVGALLLLKLGDRVEMCPQEQSPECDPQNPARRRGVIGSIPQLVAQMVFRRNETARPLAKRKMVNGAREYVRSSLSDGISANE